MHVGQHGVGALDIALDLGDGANVPTNVGNYSMRARQGSR